jgi:hypothetical protein
MRDLDAYLADPKLPPLHWLRLHVERLFTALHRHHLGNGCGTRWNGDSTEISRSLCVKLIAVMPLPFESSGERT